MTSQNAYRSAASMATVEGQRTTLDPDNDQLYLHHDSGKVNRTLTDMGEEAPSSVCSKVLTVLLSVGAILLCFSSIAGLAAGGVLLQTISGHDWKCALLYDVAGGAIGLSVVMLLAAIVIMVCACRSSFHERSVLAGGIRMCCAVCNIFLVYLFLVVSILVTLLAASFANMGKQNIVKTTTDFTMEGKDGTVTIWRDKETSIPRVRAHTRGDVFFAQGYLQAEDRLWELEFMRLVVGGRMAEFVGKAGLKIDKQTRTLGMGKSAIDMCSRASQKTKDLYQRFADGINHYLATRKERPVEFAFMGSGGARLIPSMRMFSFHEPEPFDPSSVCYAAKLIQFQMAGDSQTEARRFMLWWTNPQLRQSDVNSIHNNFTNYSFPIVNSEQLGITAENIEDEKRRTAKTVQLEAELYDSFFDPVRQKNAAKIKQIYKPQPAVSPSAAAAGRTAAVQEEEGAEAEEKETKKYGLFSAISLSSHKTFEFDLFSMGQRFASNGWVARGFDGVAGGASDPHLQNNLPSVWYPCRLEWGHGGSGAQVIATGVSLTGMPSLGVFRRDVYHTHPNGTTNEIRSTIANAITALQTDVADLWVLNMTGKESYSLDGGKTTQKLTTVTETIKVMGQPDETLTYLSSSQYGNDVTDVFFGSMSKKSSDGDSDGETPNWATSDGTAPFRFFHYAIEFLPVIDNTSADAFAATLDEDVDTAVGMRSRVCEKLFSPAFSISILDHNNTLVYATTGNQLERYPGHTGRWPTLARRSGMLYKQSSIPYAELPTLELPATKNTDGTATAFGMVATANQKVYPDGYKYDLGASFAPGYRAARIQTELRAHSDRAGRIATGRDIQQNINSGMWVFGVAPSLRRNSKCFSKPAAGAAAAGRLSDAQKSLWDAAGKSGWLDAAKVGIVDGSWDGLAEVGTKTIGFFWRTVQEFSTIFSPVVQTLSANSKNPAKSPAGESYWHALLVVEKALNGTAPAFISTLCQSYLTRRGFGKTDFDACSVGNNSCVGAFVVATLVTAKRFPSTDDARLAWGQALKKFHNNNRMMSSTPFSCMFDREYPLPGDVSTTRVSDFNLANKDFSSVVTSSMRQVYDTSDNKKMLFALPGGMSGNPYSTHYDDLLQQFKKGEYYNVSLF